MGSYCPHNSANWNVSITGGTQQGPARKCNFENAKICGFTQDTTDDFDWTRQKGATKSGNTGPSTDHTLGTGQGNLFYHIINAIFTQIGKRQTNKLIKSSSRICLCIVLLKSNCLAIIQVRSTNKICLFKLYRLHICSNQRVLSDHILLIVTLCFCIILSK